MIVSFESYNALEPDVDKTLKFLSTISEILLVMKSVSLWSPPKKEIDQHCFAFESKKMFQNIFKSISKQNLLHFKMFVSRSFFRNISDDLIHIFFIYHGNCCNVAINGGSIHSTFSYYWWIRAHVDVRGGQTIKTWSNTQNFQCLHIFPKFLHWRD